MASFKADGENLVVGLPFTIPYLDTSTISVNKANFQFFMRLVVVVCTFLLFRPHLERLFRMFTGKEDPTPISPEEFKNRVQKLQAEAPSNKAPAVAKSPKPKTPSKSPAAAEAGKSGGSRRRKA